MRFLSQNSGSAAERANGQLGRDLDVQVVRIPGGASVRSHGGRRKQEEEAKRKQEEEAKRKHEEEAKRKHEEEAKRKHEEEAKRRHQEEAKREREPKPKKQGERYRRCFVPGTLVETPTGPPQKILEKILGEVENEFRRYAAIIKDAAVPASRLRVIVSDMRAKPFFEDLMKKYSIPGEVVIEP